MVNFVIVGTLLVYNAIFDRLAQNCLQAATSTYYLIMKFLTPVAISEVKGNQHDVRRCYALAIKRNESLEIVHMVKAI